GVRCSGPVTRLAHSSPNTFLAKIRRLRLARGTNARSDLAPAAGHVSHLHLAAAPGHLEELLLGHLQAGEFPAIHEASIDPDFVRQVKEHLSLGGVTKNHRVRKRVRMKDKLLSNP